MVWVKPTQRTSNREPARIIGKGSQDNINYGLWIEQTGLPSSQICGPEQGHLTTSREHVIPLHRWTHMAMSFAEKSTHELYINGARVVSGKTSGLPKTDDEPLTLGKVSVSTGCGFIGELMDARVYNFAMTRVDILDIFSPAVDIDPDATWLSVPLDAPIPLVTKQQEAVDKDVVKGMVKFEDLYKELQKEQELQGDCSWTVCFQCNGAGWQRAHAENNIDAEASFHSSPEDTPKGECSDPGSFLTNVCDIWVVENCSDDGVRLGWAVYPADIAVKLEEASRDSSMVQVSVARLDLPENSLSTIDLSTMIQRDTGPNGIDECKVVRLPWTQRDIERLKRDGVKWLFETGA